MRYWLVAFVLLAGAGCGKKEAARGPAPAPAQPSETVMAPKTPSGRPATPHPLVEPGHPSGRHPVARKNLPTKPTEDKASKALGLPSYPGAKLATGPDALTTTTKGGTEAVQADFKTTDQAGAVHDFYIKLLTKVDLEFIHGQAAIVIGKTASGAVVNVSAVADTHNPGQTQLRVIVTRKHKKR